MKYRTVLLKSLVLVLVFAVLLSVGISLLSYSNIGTRNSDDFSTPEIYTNTVNAPLSQRQLQKKYNKYNTVTEENGKSVVTIFSAEQITNFNDRRNNGEWFWLSSEEMLFLINDTVELFKTYDIVYIRDLDGNLNKYYGLSFFSSEEYYASFNGFDLGVTDASFDLQKDIYEGIYTRCKVLNNALYKATNMDAFFLFTNISEPLSNSEIYALSAQNNPWYAQSKAIIFDAWQFNDEKIIYENNITKDYNLFSFDNNITVYPNKMIPDNIGHLKYDQTEEKVVIVELYDEATQLIVARIRLDNKNNPAEISEIQKRFDALTNNMSGANVEQITNYRAVIYLNGFGFNEFNSSAIRYCPDGNVNLFSFSDGDDTFQNSFLFLKGCQQLTEYINGLLTEYLVE